MTPSHPSQPEVFAEVPPGAWAPGASDAWWWLVLPLVTAVGLYLVAANAPDFYRAYILPEGYGFLEIGHFLMPFAAFVIALKCLKFKPVERGSLLWWAVLAFALASFYIAGEEHSWGQHFFNWSTPEYWASINRQDETNLHNVSPWFNQRPKVVFELGILVGGIILPIVQRVTGPFRQPLLALLTPPVQLMPVALLSLALKIIDDGHKSGWIANAIRPSEALETFEYAFMLFFMIVLYRRLKALDALGVRHVPL